MTSWLTLLPPVRDYGLGKAHNEAVQSEALQFFYLTWLDAADFGYFNPGARHVDVSQPLDNWRDMQNFLCLNIIITDKFVEENLARALRLLSRDLLKTGLRREALQSATIGTNLFRELHQDDPNVHQLHNFAEALHNLSGCLAEAGDWQKSFEIMQQTVQLVRDLYDNDSLVYLIPAYGSQPCTARCCRCCRRRLDTTKTTLPRQPKRFQV